MTDKPEVINPEHERIVQLMLKRNDLVIEFVDHLSKAGITVSEIAIKDKTFSSPEMFKSAIDNLAEALEKFEKIRNLHTTIIKK